MPEKPQEELETLVEIADALRKSEVDIDPKLKENLEAKVLDNIVQVADENPDYNHDMYHFISEESDYEEELNKDEEVKEYLEENDIMTSNDPFSEFLRSQM